MSIKPKWYKYKLGIQNLSNGFPQLCKWHKKFFMIVNFINISTTHIIYCFTIAFLNMESNFDRKQVLS